VAEKVCFSAASAASKTLSAIKNRDQVDGACLKE